MLFTKINNNIKYLFEKKLKIILGLSGGPDSVFLFHFLKYLHDQNKITLIAAHLDHGWRKESIEDVKFCQSLCDCNNIPFVHEHANNLCVNLKLNGSKEELGRNLRRIFFESILKKEKAVFVALGHHQQDQQETFFWRIIRGSSLCGLTCMKKLDSFYIRPLLNISKQEILDYLEKHKIKYLIDKTNNSDCFLRNRIRKYVLPAIQKVDERFNTKFESTLKHLQEEELFLKRLTNDSFETVFTKKLKTEKLLSCGNLKSFLNLDKVLQKRILIFWLNKEKVTFSASDKYFNEILRFLSNPRGGSHQLSLSWKLTKKKNLFWIEKN